MTDAKEIKVYNPPLVAMLIRAEELKEAPLTKSEVIKIQQTAPYMMIPRDVAEITAEQRGYDDIDTSDIWNNWLSIRKELNE